MSNGPVRLDGRQVAVRHVAVAAVVGVIAGSGAAAAAFVVLPYPMDLAYGSWAESMGLVFPVATAGIGIVGGAAAGNIWLDAHSSPVTTIANWTPRDAKPGPGMADYIATIWTADDREYKPGYRPPEPVSPPQQPDPFMPDE